jgi:thioredoxin-like negative regulator of GroEL
MNATTPSVIPELTNDTFWQFVQTYRFVIIHFWAQWNGYDVEMLRLLQCQVKSPINIARFEIDPPKHHDICRLHKVLNVPFLALYQDGLLIDSITGILPFRFKPNQPKYCPFRPWSVFRRRYGE